MKKRGLLLCIVLVIMMALVGCGDTGLDANTSSDQEEVFNQGQSEGATEETAADKIVFSNIIVKGDSGVGVTFVNGEATNNDSKKHSFTLTVSFYDNDKKLLGTALGTVLDLGPGDTKTFHAGGEGNYTGAASYKVQVDAMIE